MSCYSNSATSLFGWRALVHDRPMNRILQYNTVTCEYPSSNLSSELIEGFFAREEWFCKSRGWVDSSVAFLYFAVVSPLFSLGWRIHKHWRRLVLLMKSMRLVRHRPLYVQQVSQLKTCLFLLSPYFTIRTSFYLYVGAFSDTVYCNSFMVDSLRGPQLNVFLFYPAKYFMLSAHIIWAP